MHYVYIITDFIKNLLKVYLFYQLQKKSLNIFL